MTQGGFVQQQEQQLPFRNKQVDRSGSVFNTSGSSGANSKRLAQLVSVFDYVMSLLEWDITIDNEGNVTKKPVMLTTIIIANQASIDARYHNDYKAIAIAEEIDRKRSERKENGVSLTQ